jgi:hypothetical protein
MFHKKKVGNRGPLAGGKRRHHVLRSIRSHLHKTFFANKARKIGTVVSTVALVAASASMAYIVLGGGGSGSQTVQLGSRPNGTLSVTVTGLPDAMMPGDCSGAGGVQAWADNNSTQKVMLSQPADWTFQIGGVAAPAGEFTANDIGVTPFPKTLSPGDKHINIGDATVCWVNNPDVDQTPELGKSLTATATAR